MPTTYRLTEQAARRTAETVRRVHGEPESHVVVQQRKFRAPPGSKCGCLTVHEIRIEGVATGGTFDLDVAIDDDGTGAGTPETLTFNYNDTSSAVQTEYETHTEIASGDIDVKGGPLPNTAVYVVFLSSGNLNRDQPPGTPDSTSLTGTNATAKTGYMTNQDWSA